MRISPATLLESRTLKTKYFVWRGKAGKKAYVSGAAPLLLGQNRAAGPAPTGAGPQSPVRSSCASRTTFWSALLLLEVKQSMRELVPVRIFWAWLMARSAIRCLRLGLEKLAPRDEEDHAHRFVLASSIQDFGVNIRSIF